VRRFFVVLVAVLGLGVGPAVATPTVYFVAGGYAPGEAPWDAALQSAVQTTADGVSYIDHFNAYWYDPNNPGEGFDLYIGGLVFDPDPVITYSFAVTDFGAPSTFGFIFSQPIVATSTPGVVDASLSGSTTNGGGLPGLVTVTPAAPPGIIPVDGDFLPEIAVYTLSQNGGATFLNAGLDLGPAFASNPLLVSDTYGPFSGGPIAGPAGAGSYNFMRVDVNFSLSGGSDSFTANGSATVIPEPGTLVLLVGGLVALAAAGRRRPTT
jgi:hypothetical protein